METVICTRDHVQLAVLLPYERMARHDWTPLRAALRPAAIDLQPLTFQRVLALAAEAAPPGPVWPSLAAWAEAKIQRARPGPSCA